VRTEHVDGIVTLMRTVFIGVVAFVGVGCRLPATGEVGSGSGGSSRSTGESTDSTAAGESGGSTDATSSRGSETGGDSEPGQSVEVVTLAYGREDAHTLDLYLPQPRPRGPLPTLVLAHGGLWQAGGKAALAGLCQQVVSGSGFNVACVSVEHRLSQDLGGLCMGGPDTYEQQLRDFGAAVTWLQDHAESHGLDPARMFVGGHSAGGHLAHALNLRWDEFAGPTRAVAAIGIEGIYDIAAWDAYDQSFWNGMFSCATHKAFGDPPGSPTACTDAESGRACWEMGSPTYLASHAAELGISVVGHALMIHSPADNWVDITQASAFGDALAAAFPDRTVIVSDAGACAVGSHNELLDEPALAACLVTFVLSGGTTINR
jgi:acetyl esterase/lipase